MSFIDLTFGEFLKKQSMEYGAAPALICDGRTVSYKELYALCERGAERLKRDGFAKGGKAVIWGFNSIEWVIAFYSVTIAGGTAVLMNYGISAEEAGRLMSSAGASWLLYSESKALTADRNAAVRAAQAAGIEQKNVRRLEYLSEGRCDGGLSGNENAAAEQGTGQGCGNPCGTEKCGGDKGTVYQKTGSRDTCVIIFTTGTTSEPKAVQLSAYSVLNDALGAYEILKDGIKDSLCVALPLFHSYGLLVLHVYLCTGRRTHLTRAVRPDAIAELVGQGDVTDMASVGAMYAMMTGLPQFDEKVRGRLNVCIVGGGFTTPSEMMRLEQAFGGARILCGYGQTECSPVISVAAPDDSLELRAVSVGHILPGLEVRVHRSGAGFASHGEQGEIVVRGYCTMNGYFGRSADENPVDQDGWLHTGDVGRLIDSDMLQLTGRLKEIIVRCGENVSPAEVERALTSISGVRSAKVLGAPHRVWGESVEACVVPEKMPEDSKAEERFCLMLMNCLKKMLSAYKLPSHIFLYDEFPLCASGKTDIRALREDMLGRLPAVSPFSDGYDLGKTMLYKTDELRSMIEGRNNNEACK